MPKPDGTLDMIERAQKNAAKTRYLAAVRRSSNNHDPRLKAMYESQEKIAFARFLEAQTKYAGYR